MSDTFNFKELKELIDLYEKNPKEYAKFLVGYKKVTSDLIKVAKELLKR